MKQIYKWMLALVLIGFASTASAQLVGVKWGVLAGLNASNYSMKDTKVDLESKMGWQVGLMSSVKVAFLSIDPQLIFVHQTMDVAVDGVNAGGKIKTNSIDMPILVGWTVFGPLRIFAGPVFTLMNDSSGEFKWEAEKEDFNLTNLRSTCSYAVGVEARLLGKLHLDLRYNGQFGAKKDVAISEGLIGKMRSNSVSFNVGYYF